MSAFQIHVSDDDGDVTVNLSEKELREMIANSIVTGAIASMRIEGENVDGIDPAVEALYCAPRIPRALLTF
ncbi:MAG: hypothetical protein AAB575_03355 [Patescibacteria group bacterium]